MSQSSTYISIDVAVRSLAIGVYRLKKINSIDSYKDSDPIAMNDNLNSIIQPIHMKVYDINEGSKVKDTSIIDKGIALKNTLKGMEEVIKPSIEGDNIAVLIEYQMNANHGANAIFNMICFHFCDRYPIHIMKPAMKNKISFHPLLTISTFLGSCSSNYQANKQHTRFNMMYFLTSIDRLDMVEEIKNKNLDDIADTFMQCIAHHLQC